jgi:Recombinase
VPDPAESAVLARMRQWAGDGLSRRAITARLNAEGVPTKRGGRWHPTTVSRVLSEAAREADRQTSARQRVWKAEQKARRQAERAAVVAGVQR